MYFYIVSSISIWWISFLNWWNYCMLNWCVVVLPFIVQFVDKVRKRSSPIQGQKSANDFKKVLQQKPMISHIFNQLSTNNSSETWYFSIYFLYYIILKFQNMLNKSYSLKIMTLEFTPISSQICFECWDTRKQWKFYSWLWFYCYMYHSKNWWL